MKIYKSMPSNWYFTHEPVGKIERFFFNRQQQRLGLNRWMFNEDFPRLFNLVNSRDDNLFKIVSNNEELVQRLLGGIEARHSSNRGNKAVYSILEDVARSLVSFGKAYYYFYEDKELNKVSLRSFGPNGVFSFFGWGVEWVPERKPRYSDAANKAFSREIRILDKTEVMCFRLSRPIKTMLSKQNRNLATLDRYQNEGNELNLRVINNAEKVNNFDFHAWREIQDYALFRCTKSTGWSGRKYNFQSSSDFFLCHRIIRFRRNQVLLRDDILRQLSVELSKVGKRYNSEFSVEVSASTKLPSVAELNELEARLMSEEIGFKEITDFCYKR